jgi:hypothetical protein
VHDPASAPVITSPVGEIESVTLDAVYIPANEGHAAGGVVDVLTRAGSSSWDGTGFDFFGNSALNTWNFFDGGTKPGVTQNQFGGSVGGPVIGRSWFFTLFVRLILRGPRLASVDTALSRTFPVRERIHIQTRIEAYNLFNRANFALPNPILDLDSSGVTSWPSVRRDKPACSWE